MDPTACVYCEQHPGAEHCDWHPTRTQMLEIGRDMSRRAQAKERWEISTMADPLLDAHLVSLKRLAALFDEDGWPDFMRDLVNESISVAQKEWDWRHRAALKGGPPVSRAGRWRERIETVRSSVDLAFLIAYECANAHPAGLGKWVCSCPFHEDRTPSLHINVERGVWHCFGCLDGGDCFTYVQRRDGVTFSEAVLMLEQRLGIVEPSTKHVRGAVMPL
jgi:hypothetical protein